MVGLFLFLIVVIIGIISPFALHGSGRTDFYMQKLFGIMGLAMIVQMLWGHRLPLVIGPASVLLIGILATVSIGVEGIYTSLMIEVEYSLCWLFPVYCPFTSRIYSRIIVVILCLIAFTLSPVILRLILQEIRLSCSICFSFVIGFGNDFGQ